MNTLVTTAEHPATRDTASIGPTRGTDPCGALQGFLFLDLAVRLLIWSGSLALSCAIFAAFDLWPQADLLRADLATAWQWGSRLAGWVILYNLIYVAALVLLRLPLPTPREGVYSTVATPKLTQPAGRQLLYSCMIAVLTKARYEAPFPAFLVFHIANLPPMRWLMGPIFGPRSKSCYVTDPKILDPSFVEIGRNVVIGSGTDIAGHCQLPDLVSLKRTRIEDDVLIGANCTIFGGVRIRRGAMIAAGSVVPPYTTVGPGEYWSGVPAAKVRDLPRPGHLADC
ncbi:MAG: acyltransferase [Phycisphaerae bacterium]